MTDSGDEIARGGGATRSGGGAVRADSDAAGAGGGRAMGPADDGAAGNGDGGARDGRGGARAGGGAGADSGGSAGSGFARESDPMPWGGNGFGVAQPARVLLPDAGRLFRVFCAVDPVDDPLVHSAVAVLSVWVRHFDSGRRPMLARLAGQLDLYVWLIDCHAENLLAGHPADPDADEMHYTYGEHVALLTADFVRYKREQSSPGGVTDEQALHHHRHWQGFDAMVAAVHAGTVRLTPPRDPSSPRFTAPWRGSAISR